MTSEPVGVEPMVESVQRRELIHAAVTREYEVIARAISMAVRATGRGESHALLIQRTEDVVAESIRQALEHPGSYDPTRPIVAWLVGIARNVLRSEFRVQSRRAGRANLDVAAWSGVLSVIDPKASGSLNHLEVEQMLSRLSPQHRQVIELSYLQEIQGDELAEALGVPSPGAARLRVHRAVQALRHFFAPDGPEVDR